MFIQNKVNGKMQTNIYFCSHLRLNTHHQQSQLVSKSTSYDFYKGPDEGINKGVGLT